MYVISSLETQSKLTSIDTVAQTNNALIYPALGLGSILARARTISPSMLMAGVHALSSLSPALSNPEASLLPDLADVRDVSVIVAAAVVRQAVADGNAQDETTVGVVNGEKGQKLEDFIKVCLLHFGSGSLLMIIG
jgi:malate dehydrogenase (oxaloacetate-decarboxylating)